MRPRGRVSEMMLENPDLHIDVYTYPHPDGDGWMRRDEA